MKKSIVIIALIFASVSTFAQNEISFFHGKFDDALALAKKENKNVFIDAYATWCGPCKWMAKNVFTNKEVAEYFNTNFVNMKIDMEKGEGMKIRRKYHVSAYPTLIFVKPDGTVIRKEVGAHNPEQLISLGKQIVNK